MIDYLKQVTLLLENQKSVRGHTEILENEKNREGTTRKAVLRRGLVGQLVFLLGPSLLRGGARRIKLEFFTNSDN
jgi:hypothetical protein